VKTSVETTSRCIITGGPLSGKTGAIVERVTALDKDARALVLSPSKSAIATLRERFALAKLTANLTIATTAEFAATLLPNLQTSNIRIVDDVEAEIHFAAAAEPLLALEWPEFAEETLDPEVPGLRSPQRFLESAFRLIRKLRDAHISPETFLKNARVGATGFYGKPPNLASADLLFYTKDTYRDSLNVTPAELQRQFKHETYLAKILARLYASYLERQREHGIYTERDVIAEATHLLKEGGKGSALSAAFVDEAQALTLGELLFLQALFGDELANVTFAGDPNGSTDAFRGARPDRVFATSPAERAASVELTNNSAPKLKPELFRAPDQENEARFIAETIAQRLRDGAKPNDIAVLFRSVHCVGIYEEALLARDIPVHVIGDLNLFEDPRALDALALLWNIHDTYRHEWLLRTLAAPAMALSDASLAVLCSPPPDAQTELFVPDEEQAPTVRPSGKDPQRATRLGENIITGAQDEQLTAIAQERVQRFRALRENWIAQRATLSLPDFARLVWSEGLARIGAAKSARKHGQLLLLRRLLDRMASFTEQHPQSEDLLGDFLREAEIRANSDLEISEDDSDGTGVRLMTIDAARGQHFPHVFIPNARPGAFPRWYVPDAFLYSPSLGMIAKENVGDAVASRTAKFSYYLYGTKARERYNEEERRAFHYAMSRATETLTVSAWDRATRGITAPEFYEELKAQQR